MFLDKMTMGVKAESSFIGLFAFVIYMTFSQIRQIYVTKTNRSTYTCH